MSNYSHWDKTAEAVHSTSRLGDNYWVVVMLAVHTMVSVIKQCLVCGGKCIGNILDPGKNAGSNTVSMKNNRISLSSHSSWLGGVSSLMICWWSDQDNSVLTPPPPTPAGLMWPCYLCRYDILKLKLLEDRGLRWDWSYILGYFPSVVSDKYPLLEES